MLFTLIWFFGFLVLVAAVFHAVSKTYFIIRFKAQGLLPRGRVRQSQYAKLLGGIDASISTSKHKRLVQSAERCRRGSILLFIVSLTATTGLVFLKVASRVF